MGSQKTTSTGRKPQRRGRERRQAILEAALELFAKSGFRGTGLKAIGERAGVSHSAVLYHYGSAEKLLAEVLEERDRRTASQVARLAPEGGLELIRSLPEIGRANARDAELVRLYVVVAAENLGSDDPMHGYFVRRSRQVRAVMANAIRDGQASGKIRSDVDPEAKALEIVAFMDGASLLFSLDPSRAKLGELYEQYTDSLMRDLSTASRCR